VAYENIDQAVVEFEAKLGYDILSLSWEANMNKLPKTENAILLIPCHAYLYTDHSKKKGAITHRAETNSEYEVSSNYFTDCVDMIHTFTVAKNQWRERRIELLTDLDKFKAWAKDTDNITGSYLENATM